MFSRKIGHYPQEPADHTLVARNLPLHQPPMCVGKNLAIPEVIPVVRSKQSPNRSVYSIKALQEASLQKKLAFESYSSEMLASQDTATPDQGRTLQSGPPKPFLHNS